MQNKIVIRYVDKRIEKGITTDFAPNKENFHVTPVGFKPGDKPLEVRIKDLKAVFFVKDFVPQSINASTAVLSARLPV